MNYSDLAKINVNEHTEKKANLTYLSWAWAVDQLLRNDPAATWEYREPKTYGDTMMVFCTVSAFGKQMTAQLPVMDHRNRAIPNPDAFQVNVAMQRCLAKAIALHGLGLYIYAGEDLPEGAEVAKPASAKSVAQDEWDQLTAEEQKWLQSIADCVLAEMERAGATDALKLLEEQGLSPEFKTALWSRLDSKTRSALKAANKKAA
jgi:hypothetical protein